ncbi:glycosyltransferase [Allokutzneria albata]|uniref:Sterol 3beta-glucosyltransferase n=1 Tax=Allokutzneria albata TaxID=211114 RepID=A0A1G9VN42_ALLAB|nr:glycosyltransferase [Allokutzneria albata]SDM73441.1 sterol 3beta-glucosyltransferase [Allokutzneria albata]
MKALLVTHGTRGDVQPFLALAVALRGAGHDVSLAAPESYAAQAQEHDVEFAALDEGPNRLLEDPVVRESIGNGYRGLRGKISAVRTARRIKPLMSAVLHDLAAVARDTADVDVVVHSPALPAQHIAESLGVPAVLATLQPGWVPSSLFPCPMLPLPRVPKALNRATYLAVSATLRAQAGAANTWRATELGLPARRGGHDLLHDAGGAHRLVLQAFSPHAAQVDPAWPEQVRTTGFWFLPAAEAWSPSRRLAAFLDAGPPPVYIGFGSMAGPQADRTGAIVMEAVRRAGVRAVLATGWGGLGGTESSGEVLVIDQAPHDWLFPRMAAVVHHGGGGTTAAALATGRPQVVCPFVADQPHWAQRMHIAGVAPAPVHQQKLTAERLAAAITEATSSTPMRESAATLGALIRAENGAAVAVRLLEEHLT